MDRSDDSNELTRNINRKKEPLAILASDSRGNALSIIIINLIKKGVKLMAKRKSMKPSKDKKVFTQTAKNVKKINIKPKLSRGGIRL